MPMPALAVVGADHRIIRSTESFRRKYARAADVCERSPELELVLRGEVNTAVIDLGEFSVAIEAVIDAAGQRQAVLTLPVEESGEGESALRTLRDAAADSPAIVWVKDLDGRYQFVNSRYEDMLGTTAETLVGRTDAELPRTQTVDGPRLNFARDGLQEPLQLEYTVPAYEGRPSMTAFRFPLRDADGRPIGTCGVAAPSTEAQVADEEASRLMELERWSRLDPLDLRAELLEQWRVRTPVPDGGGPLLPAFDVRRKRRVERVPAPTVDAAAGVRGAESAGAAQGEPSPSADSPVASPPEAPVASAEPSVVPAEQPAASREAPVPSPEPPADSPEPPADSPEPLADSPEPAADSPQSSADSPQSPDGLAPAAEQDRERESAEQADRKRAEDEAQAADSSLHAREEEWVRQLRQAARIAGPDLATATADALHSDLRLAHKWAERAAGLQDELREAHAQLQHAQADAQAARAELEQLRRQHQETTHQLEQTQRRLEQAEVDRQQALADASAARLEAEAAQRELEDGRVQLAGLRDRAEATIRLSDELEQRLAAEREREDALAESLARLRLRLGELDGGSGHAQADGRATVARQRATASSA